MQVIPVLDLLDGHAVRAVRGERARYRPVQSMLCDGSDPLTVARALLCATGTRTLYVADLNAILRQGDHAETLAVLCNGLSETQVGVEIWLDAGFADFASVRALFDRIHVNIESIRPSVAPPCCSTATLVPVFGTESLRDPAAPHDAEAAGLAPILSLDHRAGQLLAGPAADQASSQSTAWWPSRIIAMTLDQVGAYEGPDLTTFSAIRVKAGERMLIGAGGIRGHADLAAAMKSGAAAWLVASALHDRRLDVPAAVRT
ncbi:HisA/HisF-related TIM barrel protein [Paraburkholderia sp. BL10I2N1]|uniref:HisA/HisF-related TIM barrel protein n=1 Tax=Paraburkholderia sp. BL10I2N1 TaxID=1938796 RepID=UPI00105BAF77|nr:HisA/HisF-related TIM barrel protein [Paraburkholderia sp. BL10I2N1]TDN69359.1 phosphoribosylformimino-5-aminoimidazole carboxamide ribotide isomerase [Paraburkholderia sp. BL10I2N1]